MKTRLKNLAGLFLAAVITTAVIVFIFPQVAAVQYGYFDIKNGRQKLEWSSFGRVYRREVRDTEYSKLLQKLGFKETPAEWKMASQQSIGLRCLIPPGFVDYYEGTIEAQSRMFALAVEMKELNESKARELTEHFQDLVQKGDPSEVRQYVNHLQQEK